MARCQGWGHPRGIDEYQGKHLWSQCELQVLRRVPVPHLGIQELDNGFSFGALCRAVIFCMLQALLLIQTISLLLGSRKSK